MKQTNEDLITPTPQEPIIIQQSGGSDKKFIYTLLILLVVLFMVVLGVIVFLSSKFFNAKTPVQAPIVQQSTPAKTMTQNEKMAVQKALQEQINKKQQVSANQNTDTGALEALLNESKQKSVTNNTQNTQTMQTKQIITQTAQASGKTLTQADIEKIAKLVAAQLAKTQKLQMQNTQANAQAKNTPQSTNAEDQNLVASLQNAAVDTLQEQKISTTNVKANVQAHKSKKKIDTFNKVIVQNNDSNDEFSKLTKEIDSILQSTESSQNSETINALRQEAKTHAKELRFVIVKQGDTLSSIARRVYGRASAYVKIYKANPDLIKNPNRIYIGMKLRVPVDEEYKGR